jgi:hypothetical protein
MLHDPRHDKNPTLAGFALFCASKQEDETYYWPSCVQCAVGQYLASIGRDIPLSHWDGELETMNKLAQGTSDGGWQRKENWTFGKLSDRILAHQMSQPVAA